MLPTDLCTMCTKQVIYSIFTVFYSILYNMLFCLTIKALKTTKRCMYCTILMVLIHYYSAAGYYRLWLSSSVVEIPQLE